MLALMYLLYMREVTYEIIRFQIERYCKKAYDTVTSQAMSWTIALHLYVCFSGNKEINYIWWIESMAGGRIDLLHEF